jgi:hypothetical protein
VRAATYGEPGALVFLVTGGALIAAGIVGFLRGAEKWLIPLVGAVTIVAFVQTVRTIDYLDWDDVGVFVCQQEELDDCIGYLAPAVRSLRAEILRRPIAREPGFNEPGRGEYKTRGRIGWQVTGWAVAIFSLVAWFRTLLLITGRVRRSLLLLLGIVVIILFVLVIQALEGLA